EVAQAQGDWAQADALYRESLEVSRTLARELNTPEAWRDVGVSLWRLAATSRQQGEIQVSCALLQEAEPIFQTLADVLKTVLAVQELQAVHHQLAQDGCQQ
ncbi:hypothetical protein CLD22_27305, partial [Rubrivivax gelatinosus]|nr:hypothetical protein [Rubrivivax gelatinosus]